MTRGGRQPAWVAPVSSRFSGLVQMRVFLEFRLRQLDDIGVATGELPALVGVRDCVNKRDGSILSQSFCASSASVCAKNSTEPSIPVYPDHKCWPLWFFKRLCFHWYFSPSDNTILKMLVNSTVFRHGKPLAFRTDFESTFQADSVSSGNCVLSSHRFHATMAEPARCLFREVAK